MVRRLQMSSGVCKMVGHGSKLGRKKEAAIAALLTQRNFEEAARRRHHRKANLEPVAEVTGIRGS